MVPLIWFLLQCYLCMFLSVVNVHAFFVEIYILNWSCECPKIYIFVDELIAYSHFYIFEWIIWEWVHVHLCKRRNAITFFRWIHLARNSPQRISWCSWLEIFLLIVITYLMIFFLLLIWAFLFLPLFWFSSRKKLSGKQANLETVIKLGHSADSNRVDPSRVVQLSWQPRSGTWWTLDFFPLGTDDMAFFICNWVIFKCMETIFLQEMGQSFVILLQLWI